MEILKVFFMNISRTLRLLSLLTAMAVFSAAGIAGAAAPAPAAEKAPAVVWIDGATQKAVSTAEMLDGLKEYQVIFFGEFHDSQPIHDAELDVLKGLHDLHGDKLVLSMEMFERDVQSTMNDYLAGTLSEELFLSQSRPWPQYMTAYKPMVEFAKEKGIPVLTGNIPRRMAAAYAKARSLGGVAAADKRYLPKVHAAGSDAYRTKFAATMAGMNDMPGGMKVPEAMIQPIFMAQCLKDDAMAESIAEYLDVHGDAIVYHVVGNFHSEGHLGAVEKLHGLRPDLKIAVINAVHYDPAAESAADAASAHADGGEYLALETAHGA